MFTKNCSHWRRCLTVNISERLTTILFVNLIAFKLNAIKRTEMHQISVFMSSEPWVKSLAFLPRQFSGLSFLAPCSFLDGLLLWKTSSQVSSMVCRSVILRLPAKDVWGSEIPFRRSTVCIFSFTAVVLISVNFCWILWWIKMCILVLISGGVLKSALCLLSAFIGAAPLVAIMS